MKRNEPSSHGLLHPDVHWTTAVEEHLRGPGAVVACLVDDPPPAPPAYHVLRDGRIIRWIDLVRFNGRDFGGLATPARFG